MRRFTRDIKKVLREVEKEKEREREKEREPAGKNASL